jgi:Flp pilus assembly protein TadG
MTSERDAGTVTVFIVGFMLALLFVAALVFDGGQVLNARRRAANVAESAARAGAQALDAHAARASSDAPIDVTGAEVAGKSFLRTAGYDGTVSVQGSAVVVEVTIAQRTFLLGLAGVADVTVRGRGQARAVRGIVEEGA